MKPGTPPGHASGESRDSRDGREIRSARCADRAHDQPRHAGPLAAIATQYVLPGESDLRQAILDVLSNAEPLEGS